MMSIVNDVSVIDTLQEAVQKCMDIGEQCPPRLLGLFHLLSSHFLVSTRDGDADSAVGEARIATTLIKPSLSTSSIDDFHIIATQTLGIAQLYAKNTKAAKITFTEAIKIAETITNQATLAVCLRMLGQCSTQIDEPVIAEGLFRMSLNIFRDLPQIYSYEVVELFKTLDAYAYLLKRLTFNGRSRSTEAKKMISTTFEEIADKKTLLNIDSARRISTLPPHWALLRLAN